MRDGQNMAVSDISRLEVGELSLALLLPFLSFRPSPLVVPEVLVLLLKLLPVFLSLIYWLSFSTLAQLTFWADSLFRGGRLSYSL